MKFEYKENVTMQVKPMLKPEINPELKTWLYASGSLTQQLTDLAKGSFKVLPTQEHFKDFIL